MSNVLDLLQVLQNIDGFIGAALVDSESGMAAGTIGGSPSFNIEIAAAVNSNVYQAKRRAAAELKLPDSVKDILITLDSQYHLICPVPSQPTLFFYLALQRDRANLAMARIKLNEATDDVRL